MLTLVEWCNSRSTLPVTMIGYKRSGTPIGLKCVRSFSIQFEVFCNYVFHLTKMSRGKP